ncbi:MAG TPA: DUF456 domain-containing protein [Candidatus Binatia bacterium]|jgi:hypothetical protein
MDAAILFWILATALIGAGLVGLVLPAIPGAPLIFAGLLLAAWAEDFVYVGLWTIVVLAVLALLTYGIDLWATMFGAKKFGASRKAVIGAIIGSIVGIFLGFPAVIFGPFIGAVIGELLAQKNLRQATRAGIGATIGLVLGAALKLSIALAMIGVFVVARFSKLIAD